MWRKGTIQPIWDRSYTEFEYNKQPHTPEEDKMWKQAGYDQKSYTGSMYGYPNEMPKFVYHVADKIGLSNCGYNFYRMDHMDLMPPHTDHFNTYIKKFNPNPIEIRRAVVFLEDSKVGHYFNIGNRSYSSWKAGDYFIWDQEEEHEAGNFGIEPRYTLQITGLEKKDYQYEQGFFWGGFSDQPNALGFIGTEWEVNFKFLEDETQPYMIFTGVGSFDLPFIPTEDFTIYLYEPLTFYVPGKRVNMGFYHEPTVDEYDKVMSYELDCLLDLDVNVTVKTCDYRVAEIFAERYPTLKLQCEDLFVKSQSEYPHIIPGEEIKRTKKFFCPNWRYTYHRHLIMSYLANKDGNFSWYFKSEQGLDKNLWVDYSILPEKIRKDVVDGEIFLKQNHFEIDKNQNPSVLSTNKNTTAWPVNHYGVTPDYVRKMRECFVGVVNETRFSQETGNFSEKTIDVIKAECAFVLVAPPFTLEYLQKIGFQTFYDYWDESYDLEVDPMKRMTKILQTLEYINSLDMEKVYEQIKPIVEHNLDVCSRLKSIINNV